jgi:hypothetical protein
VFGSLYHLRFAIPLEISHLIQADFRFCGVFGSLYVLSQALFCGVFGSLYELRLAQNLEITERSKHFAERSLNTLRKSNRVLHGHSHRTLNPWRLEKHLWMAGVAVLGGGGAWLPWRSLLSAMATRYGGFRSRHTFQPWRREMAARGRGARSQPPELFCGVAGVLKKSSCAGGRPGGGGAG